MPIHTVLGPIASDELGPTSMHEHLWSDANALRTAPREPYPDDSRVTVENLGFIRWNLLALEDNLRLDDPALAVRELEAVRRSAAPGWSISPSTASASASRRCRRWRGRAGCT